MTVWAGSTRRARLPADWPTIRAGVRERAGGRCEWARVLGQLPALEAWWRKRNPSQGTCRQQGTDADHIRRGDDHRPANLAWLCRRHHQAKSSWEGGTAGERHARPREKHPGLL